MGVNGDMNIGFFEDSMFIHSQASQPEPSPGGIEAPLACRVQGGDILQGVSRRLGTAVSRPVAPNRTSNPSVICKGQILEIPDTLKA